VSGAGIEQSRGWGNMSLGELFWLCLMGAILAWGWDYINSFRR
jgi:hypothetical protein